MYVFVFVAAAVTLYFATEALRQPRPGVIVAAIVWLLYAVYEFLIGNGTLCDAKCNIRVDLLLIWPLVGIATLFGIQSPGKWAVAGKIVGGLTLFLLASAVASFLYIMLVENPEAELPTKSGGDQGHLTAPSAGGTTEAK